MEFLKNHYIMSIVSNLLIMMDSYGEDSWNMGL